MYKYMELFQLEFCGLDYIVILMYRRPIVYVYVLRNKRNERNERKKSTQQTQLTQLTQRPKRNDIDRSLRPFR